MRVDHELREFDAAQPAFEWVRQQMGDLAGICEDLLALRPEGLLGAYVETCRGTAATVADWLDRSTGFADLDHEAVTLVEQAFRQAEDLSTRISGLGAHPACAALRAFACMRPGEDIPRGLEFTRFHNSLARVARLPVHETHERLYSSTSGLASRDLLERGGLPAYDPRTKLMLLNLWPLFASLDDLFAAIGPERSRRIREDIVFEVDTRGYDVVRYPLRSGGDTVRHVLRDIPASRLKVVGRFDFDAGWLDGSPFDAEDTAPSGPRM